MSPFTPPFHLPRVEAFVNRRIARTCSGSCLIFQATPPRPRRAARRRPSAPPAVRAEEPLPRWDAFGFIGWRGARIDENDYYSANRWDARFVYGGTAGYYWTTNLKLEVDVSATSPSRFDTYEQHTRSTARLSASSSAPITASSRHRSAGW